MKRRTLIYSSLIGAAVITMLNIAFGITWAVTEHLLTTAASGLGRWFGTVATTVVIVNGAYILLVSVMSILFWSNKQKD